MSFFERLREERERLGLSQEKFGAIGGVLKRAQINYEKGERHPDSAYLAAIAAAGADVLYVLTGERDGPAPVTLSAEEETMLAYFREACKEVRRAALGALLGASVPVGTALAAAPAIKPKTASGASMAARKRSSGTNTGEQVFHGQVGQAIKVSGNLDQSGISFFSNDKDKK